MADIVWTSPAYLSVEKLPQVTAFAIIRLTDHLCRFPLMGSPLASRSKALRKYRHLIYRRRFRVICRYSETEDCVYLCAVQDCRQKFPTAQELRKAENPDDVSIDE